MDKILNDEKYMPLDLWVLTNSLFRLLLSYDLGPPNIFHKWQSIQTSL